MERTINERLAIVETKIEQIDDDAQERAKIQEKIHDELKAIRSSMADVATDLAKYRSFVGGAIFIVTCICTFLYKFAGPLFSWITKIKTGN